MSLLETFTFLDQVPTATQTIHADTNTSAVWKRTAPMFQKSSKRSKAPTRRRDLGESSRLNRKNRNLKVQIKNLQPHVFFPNRHLSISHTPHPWEPEYESLEPVDWEGSDNYLSSEIKVFEDQKGVSQLGIAMSESRIAESMSRTREIDAQKVHAVDIYKGFNR